MKAGEPILVLIAYIVSQSIYSNSERSWNVPVFREELHVQEHARHIHILRILPKSALIESNYLRRILQSKHHYALILLV